MAKRIMRIVIVFIVVAACGVVLVIHCTGPKKAVDFPEQVNRLSYGSFPDEQLRNEGIPTDTPEDTQHESILSGFIYCDDEKPVPGASVYAFQEDSLLELATLYLGPPTEIITDERGHFQFSPMGLTHVIVVSAEGFYTHKSKLQDVPSNNQELRIELSRLPSVHGRVVDEDGLPISNVLVCSMASEPEEALFQAEELSGVDGSFELDKLRAGTHDLYVSYLPPGRPRHIAEGIKSGYPDLPGSTSLKTLELSKSEQIRGVELRLPWTKRNRVSGRVVSFDGKPIRNACVYACDDAGQPVQFGLEPTDVNGSFVIQHLSPERRIGLSARANGFEESSIEDVSVGSDDILISMPSISRGKLIIRTLDSSTLQAVTDAHILLYATATEWGDVVRNNNLYRTAQSPRNKVDLEGTLILEGVPSGVCSLVAYSPTRGMAALEEVLLKREEEKSVEFLFQRPAELEVVFKASPSFQDFQADGVAVACTLVSPDTANAARRGLTPVFTSDLQDAFLGKTLESPGPAEFGTHSFSLQPGTYKLEISYSFFLPSQREIVAGRTNDTLIISLGQGDTRRIVHNLSSDGGVRGIVLKETTSRLRVFLTPESAGAPGIGEKYDISNGPRWHANVTPDRMPEYIILNVPNGSYWLSLLERSATNDWVVIDCQPITVSSESFSSGNFY